MQVHPKGLLVVAVFGGAVILGLDARLGLAAVLSAVAIDSLVFLAPFRGWREGAPELTGRLRAWAGIR